MTILNAIGALSLPVRFHLLGEDFPAHFAAGRNHMLSSLARKSPQGITIMELTLYVAVDAGFRALFTAL